MTIHVPFELAYEFEVNAPFNTVFALLADIPSSASHFPKVAQLVDLGKGVYRWELEKIGAPQMHVQTVYASKYVADKKKGTVSWTPVNGEGNALISGQWRLVDKKKTTELHLEITGELQVPLPGLMKAVVTPFVLTENEKLIERYIDNLITEFGGEVT